MIVADLIAELRKLPAHLPVKVLMPQAERETAEGDCYLELYDEADAQAVVCAEARGSFVLIEGDGQ